MRDIGSQESLSFIAGEYLETAGELFTTATPAGKLNTSQRGSERERREPENQG